MYCLPQIILIITVDCYTGVLCVVSECPVASRHVHEEQRTSSSFNIHTNTDVARRLSSQLGPTAN